jgi:hypothetical protein
LKDISKSQIKRAFYDRHQPKPVRAVVIPTDRIVQHCNTVEDQTSYMGIYADSSNTHPGYCQLRLSSFATGVSGNDILEKGSQKFLKGVEVEADVPLPKDVNLKCKGLLCETFPPSAQEWKTRERKFTFPSRHLIRLILKKRCTLIKKAHPRSQEPDIEWKYNFSMAEHVIFTRGITQSQLHGFFVLKVLVDNATCHLTRQLRNKHLKSVYLHALENIPCEAWKTNFSGCILFVLSTLVDNLKAKFLPHYFISTNNLINCFQAEEIEALCVNVEFIRVFPLTVVQNIAENYGYTYVPKLIKMIFESCKTFRHNKDLVTIYKDAFIPGTLCSVKTLTRLGFYGPAFHLLRSIHEEMLQMTMSHGDYVIQSFLEFFHIALRNIRQRSSRVILANVFGMSDNIDVLKEYVDNNKIFAKDILPWEVKFHIGWMEIPEEKATDFSSLADFFYTHSVREYEKRNSTLADLAVETAVLCVRKAIEMETICTDEIPDGSLKEKVRKQQDLVVKGLKRKMMTYYNHMFDISQLYCSFETLQNHMDSIVNLWKEFPEMTCITSKLLKYVSQTDKPFACETRCSTCLKEKRL